MYKILLAAIIVSLSINIGFSQAPQKFKYQAVVRNNQGNILQNQIVSVRVAIVQNNPSGFEVYSETHKPTTNQFGLINLVIGDGTVLSGDMAGIDWSSDEYFLKIGIDITGGSTYVLLGTSQLLSVPYALYAEKAGNVNNTDTSATNEIQDLDLNQDNVLTITNKDIPTPIDLSVFMDNTDNQNLSITGDTIFISNGNQVVINDDVIDADNNPTNEIQILSFNQDTLYLSNGGFIYLGNYDNQQAISTLISKMVTDSAFMHNQLDDTKNDLTILENKHATDSALLAGQLTTNALNINHNANKIIQDSTFLKGLIDNNTSLSATNLQSFLYIRAKQTSDSAYFDGKISSNANNINSLLSGVTNNTSSINNLRYKQTSDSTALHNLISTNSTSISNHISVDGDLDSLNEIQYLSRSGNTVSLTNNGGSFQLPDSNYWTKNSNDIYYNSGKVGIGTNTPNEQLEITGNLRLPTTTSTTGMIYFGYGRFAHLFGSSNLFVGLGSGNTTLSNASYNMGFGSGTFQNLTTGDNNTSIGYYAGTSTTTGSQNVYIGHRAGRVNQTGSYNVITGYHAGYNTTSGYNNFYGGFSGYENTTGIWNSFYGDRSGQNNTTGNENTFIGKSAGYLNQTGSKNIYLGTSSGYNNILGDSNIAIGYRSGYNNKYGHGNIFLGFNAGYNEAGNNKLYIDNDSTSTPLIYGEFDNNIITINGSLGLNNGASVNEFSIDTFLTDNSPNTIPTEKAVKYYVDYVDSFDLDRDSMNEIQTLSISNDTLFLSNNGGNVKISPKHYVGELFGGGIIFYIDPDGKHGLIASNFDIASNVPWGPPIDITHGNGAESLMHGDSNTAAIVSQLGHPTVSSSLYAAYTCDTLSLNGFTDWYLPSIYELYELFQVSFTINRILDYDSLSSTSGLTLSNGINGYFSSTEKNQLTFLIYNPKKSEIDLYGKITYLGTRIRAIRRF
jgi:hypothetical protein